MKRAVAATVALASILLTAGPAQADAPGAGAFTGYEYPPESTLIMPSALCARFNASETDPLVHELDMVGTFHGHPGTGTATVTATAPYYANPEGTHSDDSCLTPAWVPGEMTITFTSSLDGTTFQCDGDGRYMRRATSVYTLEFRGECDNTGSAPDDAPTYVLFEGGQEPCPPITGCPTDPEAGSVMEGTYEQTDVIPPVPLPPS